MTRAQRNILNQIFNYLEYCEEEGFTDFRVWCIDNTENAEEETLIDRIADEVNFMADKLF